MAEDQRIPIPEQFFESRDSGFLPAHLGLTKQLMELIARPDAKENVPFSERAEESKKDELFEQACEDIARHILLNDKEMSSVSLTAVSRAVLAKYNFFLENPEAASLSRGSAVH